MVQHAQNQYSPAPIPYAVVTEPVSRPPKPPFRPTAAVIAGLTVLALLVTGGAYWLWSNGRDLVSEASVGDCLRLAPEDTESPYRIVGCSDSAARFTVLGAVPRTGDDSACHDMAGSTKAATGDGETLCLGPVGVDTAKAVNVAKQGDCLRLVGEVAERVACSDPEANYKVLKRLSAVADFEIKQACADVPGTDEEYLWNWGSGGRLRNGSELMVDRLFCLGGQ
ncbi:MAG: hypothetical protein QG622_1447 [Actinomycetota bacterium]|nr:hypothetical protein [Actinomycetota bacterium]